MNKYIFYDSLDWLQADSNNREQSVPCQLNRREYSLKDFDTMNRLQAEKNNSGYMVPDEKQILF